MPRWMFSAKEQNLRLGAMLHRWFQGHYFRVIGEEFGLSRVYVKYLVDKELRYCKKRGAIIFDWDFWWDKELGITIADRIGGNIGQRSRAPTHPEKTRKQRGSEA